MDVVKKGTPQSGNRASGAPASAWPARTRQLVGEVHGICTQWLHEPLRRCLLDFDQRLHAKAEQSHSHLEQERLFASRQRLKEDAPAFVERFLRSLEQAVSQLGVPAPKGAPSVHQPLSLLDPQQHELTAVLDQLVARSEAKGGPVLVELGYRFAVLVGSPPLDGESMPLAPQVMARAFSEGCTALKLPNEHELILMQSLEGSLMQMLGPLYELVNDHLLAAGILPGLRAFPVPRATARRAPAEDAPADERKPAGRRASDRNEPIAVLDSLREMLAQRRSPVAEQPAPAARIASSDELQTALAALQQHMSRVSDQVGKELRSAQRLREELLSQLNADLPRGASPASLSDEQSDTVELVAMLFEQMARQLQEDGSARSLLGNLQVPLLRVAVSDRGFFERTEHPARQLLGKVTEVAHDWLDDGNGGETDQALQAKLETVVERAGSEAPSEVLYTRLNEDIDQHMETVRRKAQIAERRQVEAMKGRERLQQARSRAAELMAERFEKAPPRALLRTMLDRTWSDVLALTLLRHGEQSESFATRLVITDQLLGLLPAGNGQRLQEEVESSLQQIGMHGEEATQVAQRLLGARGQDSGQDHPSGTELALRMKQRQRLGGNAAAAAAQAAGEAPTPDSATPVPGRARARAPRAEPSAGEKRVQQRLRELPYGTWFEITDPKTGRCNPRRLAWFSPVSGRSLFVNRRGLRAEEFTLPEITARLEDGRAREMQRQDNSLLDRAWQALSGSLRQSARPQPDGARP